MGPWGIAIDQSNQVIVSETFPGRVQVFRYVTDAEAAAMKARREGAEQKTGQRHDVRRRGGAAAQRDVARRNENERPKRHRREAHKSCGKSSAVPGGQKAWVAVQALHKFCPSVDGQEAVWRQSAYVQTLILLRR